MSKYRVVLLSVAVVAVGLVAGHLFRQWGAVVLLASWVFAGVVVSYDRRLWTSARILVLCWAILFAWVAVTFGAALSHHWIPQPPWMLLLFSLALVFWTAGLLLTVAVRTFLRRVRGRT